MVNQVQSIYSSKWKQPSFILYLFAVPSISAYISSFRTQLGIGLHDDCAFLQVITTGDEIQCTSVDYR